jgi:hypothetical protein
MTSMFKLGSNDLVKGVATAVFAGIIVALYGVVTAPGFDFFAADWGSLSHLMINAAAGAFVGYLGKNFLSDSNGAVLGIWGGAKS